MKALDPFSKSHLIIRDPIWGDILIPREWKPLLLCEQVQRLRGVSQLGTASLVYPGATHSRFQHSLGVYHVASLLVEELGKNGDLAKAELDQGDVEAFRAAALLHDIGQYPYSHNLEALRPYFKAHEEVTTDLILHSAVKEKLEAVGIDPQKVANIISPDGAHSLDRKNVLLHNMLDNPFDPDKLDYIVRDAYYCGVPYGYIDTRRLLRSARLSEDGLHIAITDKGVAPVESLIFSLYMMYRNVYWHHAVCIANAMLIRAVQDAIEDYGVSPDTLVGLRDSELLQELKRIRGGENSSAELVRRLEARELYERALVFQPGRFRRGRVGLYEENPKARKEKEKELCAHFSPLVQSGLRDYDILLHIPFLDRAPRFDIEVYFRQPPEGRRNPVPFDSMEVSLLGPALVHNFENQTKKIRLARRREICEDASGEKRTLAEVIRERVRGNPEAFDIV